MGKIDAAIEQKQEAHRAFKGAQADHHSKRGDQRPGSKCENEGFGGGMDQRDSGTLGGNLKLKKFVSLRYKISGRKL